MKKIWILTLFLCLSLALTGCGQDETEQPANTQVQEQPGPTGGEQLTVLGQISEMSADRLTLALFRQRDMPAEGEFPEGEAPPAQGELPEGVEPPAEGDRPQNMGQALSGETLTLSLSADTVVYLAPKEDAETGSLDDLAIEDVVTVVYDETSSTVISITTGQMDFNFSPSDKGDETPATEE